MFVELGEELLDAHLLVLLVHTFDGKSHDVDRRERQVAATDRGLRAEAVLEHTCATAHRGHLVFVAQRIVSPPLGTLVIRGVEVQEVREETTCRHLASQLIEVVVAVFGQVVHATFLLPDLDGEDSRLAVAHALVGAEQDFAHHATAFG